ncbi:MAG TPA: TonB-dependent receptor [Silvibacterium sp.]|nr:TonB-dependent receptor [Silvibacterium sp.]
MPRNFQRTALVAALAALLVAGSSRAQKTAGSDHTAASTLQGKVIDARGAPLAQSTVVDSSGHPLATTGADGSFEISRGIPEIKVSNPHYVSVTVPISGTAPLTIVLERPLETVIVSAYRSPLASADSPASTRVLSTEQLRESAAPALDGRLRQVAGFELFRRSSSLVANPTTEGVSLRGLGSTAASRSLVVLDDVPLNDPYGGWIHWEELPSLSIHSVEVVRGGASDLYGSSAIGGVIDIIPVEPKSATLQLTSSYGGLGTSDSAALGTFKSGLWSGLASGGILATDGYTLVAPDLRGPIDQPSNVHAQTALAEVGRQFRESDRAFLRGSFLNEDRHNGTPFQVNSTRLWRSIAGADFSNLVLRFWGDNEHYRQTFSSIAPSRASETPTRIGQNPATELGAAARWHQSIGTHILVLGGADTHDVRAADYETLLIGAGGILDTSARQRQTGVYGEALYTPNQWTLSGSARVDHFSNFDAVQYTSAATRAVLPSFSETVFDPRLGITRRLNSTFALNASGFRAYRAPTQNELYRTGQVGQQTTLPNNNLRSERATGWETGFQTDLPRIGSTLRVSYFWTQVNRPITALTLATTPTSTLLKRENLGQIESRGISLDFATQPARWISLVGGYQYANATVTKYAQQPQLIGNWIPQVPRNMATAQLRLSHPRLGVLSLQARNSGRQFDDDANQYLLHSYFRFDAYGSRDIGRHLQVYASGENLFDRAIQVGKTPILTLGTPRVARIGLHLTWGE